ncbi:MAG: DUF4347 domain-containing protein [Cyanobacteria bacterium J06621_11]
MSTQLLSYSPEQPFSRTSHKVSGSTTVSQLKPLEPLSQIPQATKLVFIDSSIEHISALVDGLRAGYQAYVISQTQDGIAQITHLLSKFQQVEAIHIVSHGTPGALQIGSAHLTIETAEQYSKQLKTWGRVLSLQGQLLIYGCEVAKGEHGGAFLRTLHQLTNANISASTTLTGSQAKGGDWVLDAQVGEAQASLAFDSNVLQTYEGIMAAEAYFLVDSPKNLLKSSTFGSGSFQLTNNSTTGQTISKITIDASSALFPDLVFDPDGTAGDTSGKGFTVDSDPGVGLVGHNFLNPKDGGFDALEIDFNNFQPGQTLTFSVDMDPTSTKGTQGPGPNHAASVSGFELTGATVTIKFSDGTVLQGQNYRVPNDDTASQVTLKSALPAAPTVEVLGVAGSTAAVTEASQTVRVAGPVGADIALLQVEGAFFEDPIIPAFDRDPFEANTAIAVEEFSGTIGVSGFIDIPVTLTSSDPDGGLNHFVAVIKEADGSTGATSPVIVLELGSVSGPDTTAPTATLNAIDLTTAGGTEYSFTVNYADETGLDEITTDLNDVVVTGPNGALTVTSSTDNGDSSVTYTVAAPGGDWDSADNGTYNITLQAGEVADTLGNSVAQQSLGSFDVTLAGPDVSPPVATLDADDITTAGAANHSFNIDYADASGLNAATIDVNDITVAGASGNLTITNTVDNGDGSVTYTVAAPGGDWGTADNGTYDVTLQAGEVSDTLGNSVTEQLLGSFTANIGNPPDPGSGLRIEAESYSNSFDRTAGNGGNATGFTDDVDVANTTDVEGVFHVNNIQKNEFLIYDNFNLQPGTYDLVARVATGQAQTKDRMKITIGSQEFVVNFGNTGGYNSWQDIVLPGVEIDAAAQEMRVDFVNGSFNLNYLEFQPSNSGPDTTAPTATLNAIDLTTAGGTEYSFTVNYADETGLDEITTDLNDVVVTGPNGALTVTSSTDNGDSSVTYTVAAPGGDWDSADNGTYNITLQAGEVADTLGNSVAQQSLGSFDVTLAGPDVSPPVATLDADDITTAGAANHSFNIDYADASGLNAATIDVNDITVAGASGNLTITNTVDNGDGSVTYTVAAPGGDWGTADNGTYDVTLQAGEVSDTLGNSVTEQLLGSFTANIGNPPDPGSGLRIEAESYSNSFDRTAGNGGNATGFTDDVDVANTTDVEGVFHVNNIQKNEFLIYDNFNLQPGTYDLVARVATGQAQTKDRMKITIGSQEFVVNFGNTGGYNSWQDIVLPGVEIDAAAQEMRVDFVNGSFNLNYLEFQPGSVLADGPDVIGMPDVLVTAGTTNTEIDLFAAFEDAQDSDADLIYEIVSNSNPALLAASESLNTPFTSINGKLNLSYTSGATGQSEIIIKATNSEGGVAETVPITFTVVNPAPADNAIRINAGGGTAYNEDGNAFKNVSQLTGVSFVDNSAGSDASTLIVDNRTPIGNTQADTTTPTGPANNDSLYQTHRQGSDFSYAVDIANGSYNINFHFVEPEFEDNNQRLFDIKVENQVAFDNFDIYSTIKNAFLDGKDTVRVLQAPPQESFTAIVNDGTLNIDFEGVSGNATIAAIEILSTPPSIIIQESGGSSNISEENSTSDDYTVVLGTQPTSDVTVSLSFDAGQLTPDQASLVFTTENWQDPQTVTVSAVDDAEQEGIHTADISHTVTSSDPSYNGISVSDTTFTIQDNDQPAGPTPIKFDQKLIQATNKATAGAWGPDGRLYVGTLTGFIYAYTFDDTYDNITNTEVINTIAPLGNHEILGLAFNPYDSEPRIYVTHSHLEYNDGDAPLPTDPFPYTGEVSILDGANFTNRQSLISGLPVSNHDHGVNSLAFDNEGDLYIAVGGNTNAGISDPAIGGTAESPFSAAIVKANLTDPGLNISNPEYKGIKPDFNGQIEYELPVDIIVPPELTREEAAQSQVFGGDANVKAGIDVSVYASGFRNPFDLAWGTNGKLYASDNGANPGFGDVSTGPNTQEPFPGGQSDDEFLLVVEDGYYGFPNRNRGRTDDRQNYFIGPNGPLPNYLPPEASDPNFYTEPLTTYPKGGSNNGVVEYRATAFNGELKGNILVQKFKNQLWNIDLSADGNQVVDIVNLNQVSEAEGGTEVASGLDVLTGAGGAVVGIDFTANHVTIASPVDSSVSGVTAYDIFPWRAPIIGGHDFVIGGLNFDPNATTEVFVGGVEVTGQITVSDTRIRGILPNLTGQPNELLDIVVMNGGQTSIIPDAFQPLIG